MAYMTVLKKTESQLRMLREPPFLSKAVFCGFLVGVTGVILFGSESFLFKVLIGFCAIFLSCFIVDNYEICDINKETSELRLTRLHLCQYFLGNFLSPNPYVTCKLADIQHVRVDSQDSVDIEKSYRVILILNSGVQLGVTEVFTNNTKSEHEKIAETILSFLDIKNPLNLEDDVDYEGDGSSSDDDDDDFEQISKADIEEIEEEQTKVAESGDSPIDASKPDEQAATEEMQAADETEPGSLQSGDGNAAAN